LQAGLYINTACGPLYKITGPSRMERFSAELINWRYLEFSTSCSDVIWLRSIKMQEFVEFCSFYRRRDIWLFMSAARHEL